MLKNSPNPAAHGVGTTSPRQGRLKPTASTSAQQQRRGNALFHGSCTWPSWVEVHAFIANPPRSHCRGLTVLHISRHGIDICFQQESPCSRRHGLTTKHVSRLGCTSVFSGNPQSHAAAGRLYTTRDDLTHLPSRELCRAGSSYRYPTREL